MEEGISLVCKQQLNVCTRTASIVLPFWQRGVGKMVESFDTEFSISKKTSLIRNLHM